MTGAAGDELAGELDAGLLDDECDPVAVALGLGGGAGWEQPVSAPDPATAMAPTANVTAAILPRRPNRVDITARRY